MLCIALKGAAVILLDTFRRIIIANELSGNHKAVYRFSDPDGVRTGKSGWSFGVCQFDINNNPYALLALRDCNFTTDQMAALRAQTVQNMAPMHARLLANSAVIDSYDDTQLVECLVHASRLLADVRLTYDDGGIMACADYHNQMHMSRGGKLHSHLQRLGRTVTADVVRDFKLNLPWGKKRPDDVERRHDNIIRIIKEAT
jgi:hypothetical protein